MSAAQKGLALSKKYGVADILAKAGHPNAAAVLKTVGGGRTRPGYHHRKLRTGLVHSIHVPFGHFYSRKHKAVKRYKAKRR